MAKELAYWSGIVWLLFYSERCLPRRGTNICFAAANSILEVVDTINNLGSHRYTYAPHLLEVTITKHMSSAPLV